MAKRLTIKTVALPLPGERNMRALRRDEADEVERALPRPQQFFARLRVPMQVKAGEDDHLPGLDDVEEPVGEPPQDGPPEIAGGRLPFDPLIERRIGPQVAFDAREFIEKFEAQSLPLLLVGSESVVDFGFGRRLVDDGCRHCP